MKRTIEYIMGDFGVTIISQGRLVLEIIFDNYMYLAKFVEWLRKWTTIEFHTAMKSRDQNTVIDWEK